MLAINANPPRRSAATFDFSRIWSWGSEKPANATSDILGKTISGVRYHPRPLQLPGYHYGVVSEYGEWSYKKGSKTIRVPMYKRDPDVDTVYEPLKNQRAWVYAYYGYASLADLSRILSIRYNDSYLVFGRYDNFSSRPALQQWLNTKNTLYTGTIPNGFLSNVLCASIIACSKSELEAGLDAPRLGDDEGGWAQEHYSPELERLGVKTVIAPTDHIAIISVPGWAHWFWEFSCWGLGDLDKPRWTSSNARGWHQVDLAGAFNFERLVNGAPNKPPLKLGGIQMGVGVYLKYTVFDKNGKVAPDGHGRVTKLNRVKTQGLYWSSSAPITLP
ncbi:MAG: hypothetical protein GW893_18660 [Armatimonadetes bacterium]|nr:hypothetical protein [Armatimonadota bacterium]PIU60413.1 MAG: hypothetical protein COS85_24580 [Armatimonadetes bacterium CG07_land_8_20_14_0_80_59_28]PIX39363.1 MAG: hypothetical protein COZ56_17795 [Armatimonadetes bacterium CG_4_8_14_3_um_filter_58_9]